MTKQCSCAKCQKKTHKSKTEIRGSEKHLNTKSLCHESFNVDARIKPEVICKRVENNNRTTFEIELDIKSQPNCQVIKKEVYDPKTCKTVIKHVLLLESDVKLDCIPKIRQIGKPSAKYEMDIIVDTELEKPCRQK